MQMNRRQFLVSMTAAAVAASVPKAVVPDEPYERPVEEWPERELIGSYDPGKTWFKMTGNCKMRQDCETGDCTFEGWFNSPTTARSGKTLHIQHPTSGVWIELTPENVT